MQASEASTDLIVFGVGHAGVRVRLGPDKALGFQYTDLPLSLRNLLKVA